MMKNHVGSQVGALDYPVSPEQGDSSLYRSKTFASRLERMHARGTHASTYTNLAPHSHTYARDTCKFSDDPGGTTADGVQHGGRAFKVSLKTCECTCGRPSLLHLACSHLLVASRRRHLDYNNPLTVREAEFSIETTKKTWAPRFHPYLDQSKWPEYHGIQLWPDPEWKVIKHGRRKTKRFRSDMDGWGRGGARETGNDQFQEPRERARCGTCNGEGHNTRKYSQRKRAKGNEASTSQPS